MSMGAFIPLTAGLHPGAAPPAVNHCPSLEQCVTKHEGFDFRDTLIQTIFITACHNRLDMWNTEIMTRRKSIRYQAKGL
jgi:hypothetical protein